ncbi:MAG: glycosyl hydrolase [Mucilaginibacter sp.]|nr:glycosyl hydrolase [Mucilaginibacter sp.]
MKQIMKKILLLTLLAFIAIPSVLLAQDNTLTKKEKKEGWKLLFDGKDLKGWHSYLRDTAAANWTVKDGQIEYDRDHDKAGKDLVTDGSYTNYELQLQWRITDGGNSGIIFDIQESPKSSETYLTGPEMQVLDNIHADDNKKQNHLAGCLYDMLGDSTVSKPVPVGQWNQVRLLQNKGHLTFWLNGIKTVDVEIGSPEWNAALQTSKFRNVKNFPDFAKIAGGKIALQKHPGASGWRNIKIREIKD